MTGVVEFREHFIFYPEKILIKLQGKSVIKLNFSSRFRTGWTQTQVKIDPLFFILEANTGGQKGSRIILERSCGPGDEDQAE